MVRLQDLAQKWTKEKSTVQNIVDLMMTEQFLSTLSPDLKVCVTDHKLQSGLDAGSLADEYVQTRKSTQNGRMKLDRKESSPCQVCGK